MTTYRTCAVWRVQREQCYLIQGDCGSIFRGYGHSAHRRARHQDRPPSDLFAAPHTREPNHLHALAARTTRRCRCLPNARLPEMVYRHRRSGGGAGIGRWPSRAGGDRSA